MNPRQLFVLALLVASSSASAREVTAAVSEQYRTVLTVAVAGLSDRGEWQRVVTDAAAFLDRGEWA